MSLGRQRVNDDIVHVNSVKQRKIRAIWQFKVIQGHRHWYQSKAHTRLLYQNDYLPRQVLHIKSWIYESDKILTECQRMAKVPNSEDTLPKISTGWVGRMNVTDKQTDDRRKEGSI